MVGYPESLTDPSYKGQLLVSTFPLIGNYGVPSRTTTDAQNPEEPLLSDELPAFFESSKIHAAAFLVGDYTEAYSHYLGKNSLGDWLKENGVPGIFGLDTRMLTKKIRTQGVMLAKILFPTQDALSTTLVPSVLGRTPENLAGVGSALASILTDPSWEKSFEDLDWSDPNARNLVAEGSCGDGSQELCDWARALWRRRRELFAHSHFSHCSCSAIFSLAFFSISFPNRVNICAFVALLRPLFLL
jgi:carbamoyl-phosphate synthase/aspartate carbamoyltransferase